MISLGARGNKKSERNGQADGRAQEYFSHPITPFVMIPHPILVL
jgi:hypothetical protein